MKYFIHTYDWNFDTMERKHEVKEINHQELAELVQYQEETAFDYKWNELKLIKMTDTEMHFVLNKKTKLNY